MKDPSDSPRTKILLRPDPRFVIATETGRLEHAESYARQAFRAYGPEHRLLPVLAFLFVQSRLVEVSLFPYAILLQVTPIVAIASCGYLLIMQQGSGKQILFHTTTGQ